MSIEAVIIGATFPPDVEIGDRFEISGVAQVTGVVVELVDIRGYGSPDPDYLPGDRGVRLLISATSVDELPPRPF